MFGVLAAAGAPMGKDEANWPRLLSLLHLDLVRWRWCC
jgi:hypothetical protein